MSETRMADYAFANPPYTLFVSHSVSCLWPHSLQANLTRVAPFAAETRFGAPHFPQVASMRVLPCFTTMALRAMVSRIRRSASSRIDCFDIRSYLSRETPAKQPYTRWNIWPPLYGCRHAPPPGLAFGEPDDRLQRGIQYAAASRFPSLPRWNTGSPAFRG